MDHFAASTSSQIGGDTTREQRPLETLSNAVQRVNNAQVRLQNFLDRFHGAEPTQQADGQSGLLEKQPPYATMLDRLFGALDRLETRVDSIDRIG